MILKKMLIQFSVILKMSEVTNIYSNLSDQTKFKLNEINKIKDNFNAEIQERNIMSKELRNTLMPLIILTSGGISIITFAIAIRAAVGIVSASVRIIFSLNTGIIKILLKTTRNKKEA